MHRVLITWFPRTDVVKIDNLEGGAGGGGGGGKLVRNTAYHHNEGALPTTFHQPNKFF